MTTMRQRLDSDRLSSSVVIGQEVSALLDVMDIADIDPAAAPPETTPETGHIKFLVAQNSLGVFDLNLQLPIDPRPYTLTYTAAGGIRTGFRLAIALAENGIAQPLFDLIEKIPGYGFVAATRKSDPDGSEWLEAAGDPAVHLTGIDPALVITGKSGEPAHVLLAPSRDGPDGLIVLGLAPPTVLLGGTGFGLEIVDGVAFDDATDASPPGQTLIDGAVIATPADNPTWRGIAVRNARFYLPRGVPLLGGHAVDAHLEIGRTPTPGIDLVVTSKIPSLAGPGGRPGITVRIECQDPTATGLSSFVPTLVEAAMELPLDQNQQSFGGAAPQTITFAAGKPVIVRARFSRLPQASPPETRISLAVEAQGDAGIVSVSTDGGGLGAKILVTAATLATALVADGKVGAQPALGGDGSGVWLHEILTAAVGLSSFLHDTGGGFVLHGVELISEGNGLPVGGVVKMKIDYSVSAVVDTFSVGVISVGMQPDRPFRVRVREVVLTIDPAKRGLQMINLGFDHASLEVEDPGGWEVQGPGSLFDVLGTRSGRGSMWIEVDLRFKLDLGPIKVSGATIRGTLNDAGHIEASLRGLDAKLDLSPAIPTISAYPEGLRALPLGSDLLTYQWTLSGITLLDVTDNPAGVVVPGPLSGAWQVGKFGDAGGQPEPAELALLTPQRDMWIDRVSDAGKSLPNDPLKALAELCQTTANPRVGWALGSGAEPVSIGLFLPPDPLSADPLQSRVEGTMQFITRAFNAPLSAATALRLPVPTSFAPARIVEFEAALRVERDFAAYLLPGQVAGPPGYLSMIAFNPALVRHELFTGFTVTLDDALTQGRIWLIADVSLWPPGMQVLSVMDDQGIFWTPDTRVPSAGGLTAIRYSAPGAGVGVRVVTVRWIAGFTTGYLGLGGITASAQAAANARNKANAAAAAAAAALLRRLLLRQLTLLVHS